MDSQVNECISENMLRYYLDDGPLLPTEEYRRLTIHLEGCQLCQERLARLTEQVARINELLEYVMPATLPSEPDPLPALARLQTMRQNINAVTSIGTHIQPVVAIAKSRPDNKSGKKISLPFFFPVKPVLRWPILGGMFALLLVIGLMALPPISSAADQLLKVFRVSNTIFVPVDQQRIQQLVSAGLQSGKEWFVGTPTIPKSITSRNFDSVEAATSAVGFVAKVPQTFPGPVISREILVREGLSVQFQLNVATLRQMLVLLKINDVNIPDELGAKPIKVEMPPFAEQHFKGQNYDLILEQSFSPQLSLPENVDMPQLTEIILRIVGMNNQQAQLLSQQVDLRSALIFPFPTQLNSFRQVQIGSSQGILIDSGSRGKAGWILYWQQADRFYVLYGQGELSEVEMLATANSLR